MKTIECKQVDLWDGGDRQNFGFYVDLSVSDDDIKAANFNCHISRKVITVFDSLAEVNENSVRKLRQSAWDKMSSQERVAMGMIERP